MVRGGRAMVTTQCNYLNTDEEREKQKQNKRRVKKMKNEK